jgi:ABC-type branched-subunit amino acid transport system substrate-binding protein
MISIGKRIFSIFFCFLCLVFLAVYSPQAVMAAKATKSALPKVNAAFEVSKMSDMTDYDPSNPVIPTGDTIKIALVASFSGPAALNSYIYFAPVQWAAHDINKRGGIMVDGKKKFVEIIKADHMSKADQCKKICERMVLQEKVHVLWGTDGSNMMKIINEVANKYKIVSVSAAGVSDDLMTLANFGRYSFFVTPGTEQIGRAMAYYYGQVRKKEKKFYILCQDYSFGHGLADAFKKGLKEFYPEAQLVGEDYHKLFLTDFAPYLTKIKAAGAEVIWTGDWTPDAGNLLKQARQLGITIPFANLFMDEPNMLHEVGVEGTKGLVHIDVYDMPYVFKNYPDFIKFYSAWHKQWQTKWKAPYNTPLFGHGTGAEGLYGQSIYWLLSVIERAKSTDAEKIISVWENDTFRFANGKSVKMRACDHKMIGPMGVTEFVEPVKQKMSMTIPPYYWYKGTSSYGPGWVIPADKVLPSMDKNIDRCKGKNDWGE